MYLQGYCSDFYYQILCLSLFELRMYEVIQHRHLSVTNKYMQIMAFNSYTLILRGFFPKKDLNMKSKHGKIFNLTSFYFTPGNTTQDSEAVVVTGL